jgi:hypothetical protein
MRAHEERASRDSSGPVPVVKKRAAGTFKHEIRDAFGVLQGTHCRKQAAIGKKELWWEPDLDGRRVETMPLYGSELVRDWRADLPIILTEGEPKAKALRELGFGALGTVTGAKVIPDAMALAACAGRDVYLWPDNDQPGRAHMHGIGRVLVGRAASISVVEWSDAPPNGDAVDFLADHGVEDVEALLSDAHPWAPASSIEIVSASSLMAMDFPELQWAIDRILPEGAAVLAAAPKIGKSWLVDDWAVAIALGGFAMGSTKVDAGQVLLLPLEDSPRRMQSRLRRILRGRDVPPLLDVAFDWPRFGAGFEEHVHEWVAAHDHARLIVVDTLAKVRPQQKGNRQLYEVDYEDMSVLASIVKARSGLALAVVHHDRKAEADDFLDAVSGSHGITGAADTVLVLRRARRSADAVLHVTGRDVEEDAHALTFDAGLWELTNAPIPDASQERNDVVAWLLAHGPAGPGDVAKALGKTPEATRKLMLEMKKRGQLLGGGQAYKVPFSKKRRGS